MQTVCKTLLVTLALTASSVWAHDGVQVKDAWVRATVAQQHATGAFMTLQSTSDSKLVRAMSPVSEHVEIHEMALQDNVMKMRQVPVITLPAGQPVALKPGGYHIMLIGLKQQVRAGEQVPLTLEFEHGDGGVQRIDVQAPVRPLTGKPVEQGQHGHAHPHRHQH